MVASLVDTMYFCMLHSGCAYSVLVLFVSVSATPGKIAFLESLTSSLKTNHANVEVNYETFKMKNIYARDKSAHQLMINIKAELYALDLLDVQPEESKEIILVNY